MHRTLVFAKLVAHILSESCEYNHESQDFRIKFEGAEFTLKIDSEAATAITTTVPNVHTTPVTTEIPITTITSAIEGEELKLASIKAAVVEKLSAWNNKANTPCKSFKEKNEDDSTFSQWNVCPFGGLGEVTDNKHTEPVVYTGENDYWKLNAHSKEAVYCMSHTQQIPTSLPESKPLSQTRYPRQDCYYYYSGNGSATTTAGTFNGWWSYEVCPGQEMVQFHQTLQRNSSTKAAGQSDKNSLGKYSMDFDWDSSLKTYVQYYSDGTICGSREPYLFSRTSEIHWKCHGSGETRVVRVEEPINCHYVIHMHSAVMCLSDHECADSKKLEITFVCQQSTRDTVKGVTRSGDECTIDMEIATSAACYDQAGTATTTIAPDVQIPTTTTSSAIEVTVKPNSDQCGVAIKFNCGPKGVTKTTCERDGCCWRPGTTQAGVVFPDGSLYDGGPWCYKTASMTGQNPGYNAEISHEVASMKAAIVQKLRAWSNRSNSPCKSFKEKNGDTSTQWNVCPFGDQIPNGGSVVTDNKPTTPVVYTRENAYWEENEVVHCMTAPGHDECGADGKKLRITFVCQTSTRDAVKEVTRSDDECNIEMKIATIAAC